MSIAAKTSLLILTLTPFIWIGFYFSGAFQEIFWPIHLGPLFLVGLFLLVTYISLVIRNSRMSNSGQVSWVVLFLLFGTIAQIAYWILWVRRN